LNLKLDSVDYQFHRYYHLKRKSYKRKLRRWLINIVGSYSPTDQLDEMKVMSIVSCSSNPLLCLTKRLTDTSTRQWWSSQLRYSKQLSIKQISQNLKKKSIGFSDQMHSTFQLEFNMTKLERRSSHNWKKLHQMRRTIKKLS